MHIYIYINQLVAPKRVSSLHHFRVVPNGFQVDTIIYIYIYLYIYINIYIYIYINQLVALKRVSSLHPFRLYTILLFAQKRVSSLRYATPKVMQPFLQNS